MMKVEVEYNSGSVKIYENIKWYEFETNYVHLKRINEFTENQEIYIPIYNVKQIWVLDEDDEEE